MGEEGTPVAEICRVAGISQANDFNRKKRYAGLMPSEMRLSRCNLPTGSGNSGQLQIRAVQGSAAMHTSLIDHHDDR